MHRFRRQRRSTQARTRAATATRRRSSDILATEDSNSVSALYTYEDYLAKQLPVIWLPVADAQLSEINKDLKGTGPQDPLLQIYPENWRWS